MIGSDILTLFPGSQTLLGKNVSDMVEDDLKVFEDGNVTGTFKYVSDFTDFSSNADEQKGYYFPFKLTQSGTQMTFKKNGVETKIDIPFDPDIIFRVTKDDTFEVLVDDVSVVTFRFERATFREETNGRAAPKTKTKNS